MPRVAQQEDYLLALFADIDPICINQDDMDERSWQVRLMAQIFRNASRTIAYIGEADMYSSAVSIWCRNQELGQFNSLTYESDDSHDLDLSRSEAEWSARILLGRPWFTRTW